MSKPIFTGLAPNTELDDTWLAAKLLFQPWRWSRGEAINKLEQTFEKYLPIKHAFAFASGRTSLYAILSALDLQANDEVLMQAYTCVSVADPILWAGAKPIYVDVEQDTFNMSARDLENKISDKSKVLIIQHTFGLPADIEKLMAVARKHNLFVIEDCAHALGSEVDGKKVGTFGDVGFFSFGRDKVISSVFGGLIVTNNDSFAAKFKTNYSYPSKLWTLQQLLHPIGFTKLRICYNLFYLAGKLFHALMRALHITSKTVYKIEKSGGKPSFFNKKMPNALAQLALYQFKKLKRFNEHRREIAALYTQELSQTPLRNMIPCSKNNHLYMRYTMLTPRAGDVLSAAKKKHIFLGDWYRQGLAPAGVNYQALLYNPGACPIAEKLASESFNLPTDIHISKKDVKRIVAFLKTAL